MREEFDAQGGAIMKGGRAHTRLHTQTHTHTNAKPHTWFASAHIFRLQICMSNGTEILGGVVINSVKKRVSRRRVARFSFEPTVSRFRRAYVDTIFEIEMRLFKEWRDTPLLGPHSCHSFSAMRFSN